MISSLLRLASIVCCLIIAISFAGFASDQAGSSSKQTVAKIGTEDENAPGAVGTRPAKHHGAFRQKVDKANDVLTHPFTGIASSGSRWQQRIVAALLGLLVFGVGLGFLGRYAALRGV